MKLGLLKGSVARLIKEQAYLPFFNHRTGHWLGLDVHDVGDYKVGGEWRVLEPGMALTVEPGIYIRPSPRVPKEFWNIGVRIEDDVLVTEGAPGGADGGAREDSRGRRAPGAGGVSGAQRRMTVRRRHRRRRHGRREPGRRAARDSACASALIEAVPHDAAVAAELR